MSEGNPIAIFASHIFDETDDYLRVFEFLEGVDHFFYINVSKPENVPETGGLQAVKDELIDQIKTAEVVIILSSLYERQPDVVNNIMDVAVANKIGLIAVRPFGGISETPAEVTKRCQQHVGWNAREIADAVRLLARHEDTRRWEVLDFPGYDADGPTD